jgi:hypothetical protein
MDTPNHAYATLHLDDRIIMVAPRCAVGKRQRALLHGAAHGFATA